MDRGRGIFHGANIMYAVAIDTSGDGFISRCQTLAVHAGLIQLELVDTLLRPESAHEIGTPVTFRAKLWDCGPLGLAGESFRLTHGDGRIVARGIAAVAVRAAQSVGRMYVVFDQRDRSLEIAVHRRVTLDARILGRLRH